MKELVKCPHCGKEYCKKGIGTHIWRMHGEGQNHQANGRKSSKGRKAWNKGLTKDTDERIKKYGQKISQKAKNGEYSESFYDREYCKTDEYRENHSNRMKEIVKEHPESYSSSNVSGRAKIFEFEYFGKNYKFKGSWECIIAEKLFEDNIFFENEITPFEYIWEEKKSTHLYFPDFYLPEYDLYLEVKGYERQRDRDKWKVVDNLKIIKQKEIDMLKNGISIKYILEIE